MLVSKQWQRVYLSTPALHDRLALQVPAVNADAGAVERWLLSSCQRIERVGHLCTSLAAAAGSYSYEHAHPACMGQLAGMLSTVPPATLSDLRISIRPSLPSGLASWLSGMSRLTSLVMKGNGVGEPEAAALASLSQLRQLCICTGPAPAGLVGSLLRLSQLTSLQLTAETLPPLDALTRLQQLHILEVEDRTGQAAQQPPRQPLAVAPPSAFPSLHGYNLNVSSGVQVSGLLPLLLTATGAASVHSTGAGCVPLQPAEKWRCHGSMSRKFRRSLATRVHGARLVFQA